MASAALASHNESNWGQNSIGFMGNISHSNNVNLNPNSTSVPKKKKKKKQFQSYSAQVSSGWDVDSHVLMQTTATSEDAAHSFNQKYSDGRTDLNNHGSDYVRYDISSCSRIELVELKNRLKVELEQIHGLYERIESGSFQPQQSSLDGLDQLPSVKMKKKPSGKKRPANPFGSSLQDQKRLCQRPCNGNEDIGDLMKKSRQVLTTLMKHKHSWVFKEPVDALSLGLHDYHQIVKNPMDLGSVKAKFSKNSYATPMEFAEDVRLTFDNAMLYNPKTDKVYAWAGELLARFEDLFRPIEEKMSDLLDDQTPLPAVSSSVNEIDLQRNSWNLINSATTPEKEKRMKKFKTPLSKNYMMKKPSSISANSPPPAVMGKGKGAGALLLLSKANNNNNTHANLKLPPKPKAKDVDKREMSTEEKDRLSMGLQNLPEEKMPQLIHIIRKRGNLNLGVGQVDEEEIELDIETLDIETLWELDRFVTNWKKMVSKNKRHALLMAAANNNIVDMAVGGTTAATSAAVVTGGLTEDDNNNMVVWKEEEERKRGEDDVGVGGVGSEMAMMMVIDKDGGGACGDAEEQGGGHGQEGGGSSSSSRGGSSSSGGSDSSSSSSSSSDSSSDSGGGCSDSDDEAQSRGGGR